MQEAKSARHQIFVVCLLVACSALRRCRRASVCSRWCSCPAPVPCFFLLQCMQVPVTMASTCISSPAVFLWLSEPTSLLCRASHKLWELMFPEDQPTVTTDRSGCIHSSLLSPSTLAPVGPSWIRFSVASLLTDILLAALFIPVSLLYSSMGISRAPAPNKLLGLRSLSQGIPGNQS